MQQAIKTTEVEYKTLMDKLKRLPAIRRLDDFIEGRVSHFVIERYGTVEIGDRTKLVCEDDRSYHRRPARLKLLTMWGEDDGTLSFDLNKYHDGSGSGMELTLCCSEEEAKQIATDMIEKLITLDKGCYLDQAIESADKIGIPVAEEHREKQRLKFIEVEMSNVKKARENLDAAEKKLKNLQDR